MNYKTCIGFKDEHLARVEKVCADTRAKDPTFRWIIKRSLFEKYDWVLVIHSRGKRQAHARGLLMVKKYLEDLELVYWVKESKTEEAKETDLDG